MSQCNFCTLSDPSVDQICCSEGQQACADCILSRSVNESTVCIGCRIPLKKKITGLLAKIQLSMQSNDARRTRNMGTRNQQIEQMGNMINTLKKNQGYRANQNQNQCYPDNCGNYFPGQPQMIPNFYPNYGMQQGPYQSGYYYGHMNGQTGQMMYGPMNPINMLQQNPQFAGQNPQFNQSPTRNKNNTQSQFFSPEDYELFTQMRMMKNAYKGIMPPSMNSPEEEEKGQGRFWHGEHNDVVYNGRNQCKTTDMMEQSTVKSKLSKMTRSNSLSSLSLQR